MNEVVFGFVAAVGVDLSVAEKATARELKNLGYRVVDIRVTRDVFKKLDPRARRKHPNYYTSTTTMMDVGDDARKAQSGRKSSTPFDAVALGIASAIRQKRSSVRAGQKTAYLVHSLKHPHEVLSLRNLYQRGFYLIGVHAPAETRRNYLMKSRQLNRKMTDQLMDRDKQEDDDWGQKLVDTFHLADVFFGLTDGANKSEAKRYTRLVQNNVKRFIEIVFGHPNRTPTFGEYAMFLAFSASLRSADLSRQVGAVITRTGEILGAGANDCPQARGGLYWPTLNTQTLLFEDVLHGRDYTRGEDSNRKQLIEIKEEVLINARKSFLKLFEDVSFDGKPSPGKLTNLLINKLSHVLEHSAIRDLTEFGRVVHAEMEALLSCARKGVSTIAASLFSTTFPCHNCAKHIIAAGIKRVVFIEPYLKSKALDMYEDDSVEISYASPLEKNQSDFTKVSFEPFVGIGPRRFLDLFSMNLGTGKPMIRKDGVAKERAKKWDPNKAEIRIEMTPDSYLEREERAAKAFMEIPKALQALKASRGLVARTK